MSQMTIAKLKCYQCNHSFPLNMYRPISEIRCPYCDEEMDTTMIERVRDAWGHIADLNQDFEKYSYERDEPRFSLNVSIEEVHLHIDDDED